MDGNTFLNAVCRLMVLMAWSGFGPAGRIRARLEYDGSPSSGRCLKAAIDA